MWIRNRHVLAQLLAAAAAMVPGVVMAQETIVPSTVNPAIHNGDTPYLVYGGAPERRDARLVVFLPGTNGVTATAPRRLLHMLADHGLRAIYLSYDDRVAGTKLCTTARRGCFAGFRRSRLWGGDEPVRTPSAEAIIPRLTDLLRYLDRTHPDAGWGDYVTPSGPAWPRIVISGLSQGAGMAAYLAKRYPVDRVVLFSSPWDYLMPGTRPASWLSEPSVTPPERWWAERHVRENTTEAIARAYAALRIPRDHILLFDGPAPPRATGDNPYHGSTVWLPQYEPQWQTMYGTDHFDDGRSGR